MHFLNLPSFIYCLFIFIVHSSKSPFRQKTLFPFTHSFDAIFLFFSLLPSFSQFFFLPLLRLWLSFHILLVFTGRQSCSLSIQLPLLQKPWLAEFFKPFLFCLASYSLSAKPLLHCSWNKLRTTVKRLVWKPLLEVAFALNFVTGTSTLNKAETRTGPRKALILPHFRRECIVDRVQNLT